VSAISPVFNRILPASTIEETVTASLKLWFPTYLRELEQQTNLPKGTFEPPENYSDRNSFDAESAEQLPKVVVIAPGTIGAPRKAGDNRYAATWRLGIGIAVGAKTETRANMLVKGYGAAARGLMLQNSGLEEIGGIDITWTEESYDDLPIPDLIQLVKAASLYFDVQIADIVTRGGGPTVPDNAPYTYGEVEEVDIDIEKIPVVGGG
jgi:hypothetical protein